MFPITFEFEFKFEKLTKRLTVLKKQTMNLYQICFTCWFRSLSVHDRNSLNSIVNTCSKIIGIKQRDLSSFCDQQIVRKAASILKIPDHILVSEFVLMTSGKRYAMPVCKSNRYLKSFLPSAVQLLNKSKTCQ